jgi:hypothetical protein
MSETLTMTNDVTNGEAQLTGERKRQLAEIRRLNEQLRQAEEPHPEPPAAPATPATPLGPPEWVPRVTAANYQVGFRVEAEWLLPAEQVGALTDLPTLVEEPVLERVRRELVQGQQYQVLRNVTTQLREAEARRLAAEEALSRAKGEAAAAESAVMSETAEDRRQADVGGRLARAEERQRAAQRAVSRSRAEAVIAEADASDGRDGAASRLAAAQTALAKAEGDLAQAARERDAVTRLRASARLADAQADLSRAEGDLAQAAREGESLTRMCGAARLTFEAHRLLLSGRVAQEVIAELRRRHKDLSARVKEAVSRLPEDALEDMTELVRLEATLGKTSDVTGYGMGLAGMLAGVLGLEQLEQAEPVQPDTPAAQEESPPAEARPARRRRKTELQPAAGEELFPAGAAEAAVTTPAADTPVA